MMTPFKLRKRIQCNQVYFKINFKYVVYIAHPLLRYMWSL